MNDPGPQEQLHCQVQPRGLQCGEKPIGHLALPGAASDGSAQTGKKPACRERPRVPGPRQRGGDLPLNELAQSTRVAA